ncbi:MAG TPA: TadE/TadG family type IV pilus assembly protein [Rhizomicrobium sp.]|nr:TadE/TadG family type IV pilus assembly protein [Rhizomicrobium sp.]
MLTAFLQSGRANIAMITAFCLIPVAIAAGGGVDLARSMVVRSNLASALDAAGLAIGATPGLTHAQMQTLAQQYFTANYSTGTAFGVPNSVSVLAGTSGSGSAINTVTVSTNVQMPTTLMKLIGINTVNVGYTSKITWGQTKLWVSLVLDNTLSMCEPDTAPACSSNSKIGALISAITGTDGKSDSNGLLYMLKTASNNPGDVQVALVPFTKDVNLPASISGQANMVDFTDFQSAPPGSTPGSTVHAGSACPYVLNTVGYECTTGATNGSTVATTIPATCTVNGVGYSGCICPSMDMGVSGANYVGPLFHFYNGCYDSVSIGSGQYSHTWHANNVSTWDNCVMDRAQNYDISNSAPTGIASEYPAENNYSCPSAALMGLNYNWSNLTSEVNAMTPNGTTNQPIGLVWGWQAMSQGAPFNPGPLPTYTSRIIILVSDGLNTQDRWYTGGVEPPPEYLAEQTSVDARMTAVCNAVKADGVTIYTVYVDLNGTQGNSAVLQACASDPAKYFDLTTAGQIVTTLNQIGTQITQLRVAQ